MPAFQRVFVLHIPPAGNLTGHGLAMALLGFGLSWAACEKLIVTLCMISMAAGFDYAATGVPGASRAASFLVLPFLYNWPLQMGFWSFSLGVPCLLVCIGLCLRYRNQWNARSLALLFVAIAVVYLCHPISWAVCGIVMALTVLAAEWKALSRPAQRSRAVRQVTLPLLLFVPFAIPDFVFATQNKFLDWNREKRSIPDFFWPFYAASPVHLFHSDGRAAKALFVLLLLGSVLNLTLRYRRRDFGYGDILLAAAMLLVAMGLCSPERIGEGTYIAVRLLLFGFLIWSLWLGLTLPKRAAAAAAMIAVLIGFWLVEIRLPDWRAANAATDALVRLGSGIPAGSYLCELDLLPQSSLVRPLEHAIDLIPARQFVDVRDYEAGRAAFWTRFRPGYFLDESYLHPASVHDFEGALNRFEQRTGHKLDYLALVDMRDAATHSLQEVLPSEWREFTPVGKSADGVALFRRQ